MDTAPPSSSDVNAWREAHAHLTMAVSAARDAVAAERVKRRYLLEEICANIAPEGDLVPGSNWSRAATKAATAARRAKAAAAGGAAAKKRYLGSSVTGVGASMGLKKGAATAFAHKQRREREAAAAAAAARKKAALGHGFGSSEEDEEQSLKSLRCAPSTGGKRAPLKKRKKAALAAAAAAADESGNSSANGGKKKTKKIRLSLSMARAKQASEEVEEAAAEADNVFAPMHVLEPQEETTATTASAYSVAPVAMYGGVQPPYGTAALHANEYLPVTDASYAHALYSAAGTAAAPNAYDSLPMGDAVAHSDSAVAVAAAHQQPSTVEDLLAQYGQQEDPPDSF